ncbi:aspartate aminotransferase [compost metagenome]
MKTDEQIQQFFRDMYIHGSRKTGVACVPGVAFGMNPTQKLIRFSCAVEMNDLVEAMDIIQEAVEMILVKRVLLNQ